jgi:hypothetical protein
LTLQHAGRRLITLPRIDSQTKLDASARAADPACQAPHSGGYDGDVYRAIAVDPLSTGHVHTALDKVSRRPGRPLDGRLGWPFNVGRRSAPDRSRSGWERRFPAAVALALLALCGAAPAASLSSVRTRGAPSALQVYGGLGSWLDIFAGRPWLHPAAVVASAKAHDVGTLYLQTSNYSQAAGIVRAAALGSFIEAAHAAGLKVVAWYLPSFSNPALDSKRARAAIAFRSARGQRFDGFALDIEASYVANVSLRNSRLLALARSLRDTAPTPYPLGAIIPSPVGMHRHPHYWPRFPYLQLASIFDAFLPMAYFSYYAHTPAAAYSYARDVVLAIRAQTGRSHPLIHLIAGSSRVMPAATLSGFVRAASDCGVQGISLYAFPQTSAQDWTDLEAANLGSAATPACQG